MHVLCGCRFCLRGADRKADCLPQHRLRLALLEKGKPKPQAMSLQTIKVPGRFFGAAHILKQHGIVAERAFRSFKRMNTLLHYAHPAWSEAMRFCLSLV